MCAGSGATAGSAASHAWSCHLLNHSLLAKAQNPVEWICICQRYIQVERSLREVQQDLLLSCLTIGQAYCLLEVLQ